MAEKQNITQMFITMGFSKNHIGRAFTVYERNFGHSYNIEVITEIIFRLQRKDQSKKDDSDSSIPISHTSSLIPAIQHEEQKKFANMDSFVPHLTISEAKQLQVHDKLDHRDRVGRFVYGTVVDIQGTNIKIHYDGWSRKWDTWSDYSNALTRFANPGSISNRPAHRFMQLKKGDYVDINPSGRHPGWKVAEIRRLDHKSGQVQVVYESLDKNYLYWTHLDNHQEIAEFRTKCVGVNQGQLEILQDRQRKYPIINNEKIVNPYNIGDKLCAAYIFSDDWCWTDGIVIDKENNWIVVRICCSDNGMEKERKYHVMNDRDKINDSWYFECSFAVLKDNKLVNCLNEWKSVKRVFGINTQHALQWLKIQKQQFRVSRLSYILLVGFVYELRINIPMDVQRIIVAYCNLMFVKLFYNYSTNMCSYRALDTNITVQQLGTILKIEHSGVQNVFINMFSRFGNVKELYVTDTNHMKVSLDDLEGQDANRWVEIPADYGELWLGSLDNYKFMKYDQVLEIGVDVCVLKLNGDIMSSFKAQQENKHMSGLEWIFLLQIGDIIDVYNNNVQEWCQAVIKYISESKFYVHYIGYSDYDEIIDITDVLNLSRIQMRYSQCKYPFRPKIKNENELLFCWRTNEK
eukprot:403559_1